MVLPQVASCDADSKRDVNFTLVGRFGDADPCQA
jgi:hypothetical protein